MAKQKFWPDFYKKMLRNGFLAHIARNLKITTYALSGARNVLETSNLDQKYLVEVSSGLQRDF